MNTIGTAAVTVNGTAIEAVTATVNGTAVEVVTATVNGTAMVTVNGTDAIMIEVMNGIDMTIGRRSQLRKMRGRLSVGS